MTITVSNNNIKERKYILNVIFREFLGIDFNLIIKSDNNSDWNIELENKNKLIVEDWFFNKYTHEKEYLNKNNIPTKVELYKEKKIKFLAEKNIPVIFGLPKLKKKVLSDSKEFHCGIDIFASSFFMLTRWEEYVNKERDNHNRFSSCDSLAFKNNFLHRPVVNEYVFFLQSLIQSLDFSIKIKKREYKMLVTHDVDVLFRYSSWRSGLVEIVRDISVRKNPLLAFKNTILKIKSIFKISKDPYDTFDFLMNLSETNGLKSFFFFMAKGITQFDNRYSLDNPKTSALIERIKKRGHHVGIHPTYNSYNDVTQFSKEKTELKKASNITNINFGRQHFLRFEVPTTWQIWEDNNMNWDSTLSYADREGFRCGVCYEFPVFNFLTRKELNLYEMPLTVMEGSFATYQKHISKQDMIDKIVNLQKKVKKYNGTFVFLWHNSSFNTPAWNKYKGVYEYIIELD